MFMRQMAQAASALQAAFTIDAVILARRMRIFIAIYTAFATMSARALYFDAYTGDFSIRHYFLLRGPPPSARLNTSPYARSCHDDDLPRPRMRWGDARISLLLNDGLNTYEVDSTLISRRQSPAMSRDRASH